MSLNPNYVYRGPWVDRDGNSVSGGRITMTAHGASTLSIFAGVYVVFIEMGLWATISYAFYQWRVSSKDQDALYHQQQVILRNANSDISTSTSMFSLWKLWRPRKIGAFRRSISIAAIAMVNFLFFTIAMPFILTYLSTSGSSEVLIHSPNCGYWESDATIDQLSNIAVETNMTWAAISYVENCYDTGAPSSFCDENLISRRITWTPGSGAQCPFAPELCLEPYYAFSMLTGYIDSHKDLGINAPPQDRIIYQRQTTCAPLNVTGRTTVVDGEYPGEKWTQFFFGPLVGSGDGTPTTFVSSYAANSSQSGYVLSVFTEYTNASRLGPRTFTPIPELQRPDGDVTLVFLANYGIEIAGPCEDPMFAASQRLGFASGDSNYYIADNLTTVMGCVDQYSVMDPNTRKVTPFSSAIDIDYNIQNWKLNHRQNAALQSIYFANGGEISGIGQLLYGLGADALKAKRRVWGDLSGSLPNNQWTVEASYWFDISLANFQLALIDIATGPPDTNIPSLVNLLPSLDAYEQGVVNYTELVCDFQKVKTSQFTNFYTAGLIAYVVFGLAIILLPLFIIGIVQKRFLSPDRRLAWISDGDLELLRLANEGYQTSSWERCAEEIPLTKENPKNQKIGTLSTADPKHPILVKPKAPQEARMVPPSNST